MHWDLLFLQNATLPDPAWAALAPHLPPLAPQGRRTASLRTRMEAIFHHAATPGAPWHTLPSHYGRPDTVARFFRRLTHAGLWHRLLRALADAPPSHPLRLLQHAICRAARLAARLGGMPLLILIRRLGLRAALPAPPWLLPDPLLSETVARLLRTLPLTGENLRSLMAVARTAGGRRRIPRSVRLSWP